jgi:2,4-dienoyl-CoA reductase (NADPH2)
VFQNKRASCLVNPQACHETELVYTPTTAPQKVAVVGAGPAGLSCAAVAAERGHAVTLFEADIRIGGQFNMAKTIPGKAEFEETLRYYGRRIEQAGVTLRLGERVGADALAAFDVVVVATGVSPRKLSIPGADHPKVVSYLDVLARGAPVGPRVAVIGTGGIGHDVAELLADPPEHQDLASFLAEWGVDYEGWGKGESPRGGLREGRPPKPAREIVMLQRSPAKRGSRLGKTTGWIHRASLKHRGVRTLAEVEYVSVDDAGLHIRVGGVAQLLEVDTVVVCAGQTSLDALAAPLREKGKVVHVIGGAHEAAELDARRAIDQGARVAAAL